MNLRMPRAGTLVLLAITITGCASSHVEGSIGLSSTEIQRAAMRAAANMTFTRNEVPPGAGADMGGVTEYFESSSPDAEQPIIRIFSKDGEAMAVSIGLVPDPNTSDAGAAAQKQLKNVTVAIADLFSTEAVSWASFAIQRVAERPSTREVNTFNGVKFVADSDSRDDSENPALTGPPIAIGIVGAAVPAYWEF